MSKLVSLITSRFPPLAVPLPARFLVSGPAGTCTLRPPGPPIPRSADVSPTSSINQPCPLFVFPPSTGPEGGCLVCGLELGRPCPGPTASAHSSAFAVAPTLSIHLSVRGTRHWRFEVPYQLHRTREAVRCAATQRLGLPTAIFVILPVAISRRILPPVASCCGPALCRQERFAFATWYYSATTGAQRHCPETGNNARPLGTFTSPSTMPSLLRLTKQSSALGCRN